MTFLEVKQVAIKGVAAAVSERKEYNKDFPNSLKALMKEYEINAKYVDYLLLYQANQFMLDGMRKKLNFPKEKAPNNIDRFGNTSGTSIPLLMVTELHDALQQHKLKHLCCGFGVGLSLGSAYFMTDHIVVPELIEVKQ